MFIVYTHTQDNESSHLEDGMYVSFPLSLGQAIIRARKVAVENPGDGVVVISEDGADKMYFVAHEVTRVRLNYPGGSISDQEVSVFHCPDENGDTEEYEIVVKMEVFPTEEWSAAQGGGDARTTMFIPSTLGLYEMDDWDYQEYPEIFDNEPNHPNSSMKTL